MPLKPNVYESSATPPRRVEQVVVAAASRGPGRPGMADAAGVERVERPLHPAAPRS